MRIHISYGSTRKNPQAGDEKFVKKTGKTMIRQQLIVDDPMHGRCHVVSGRRPVWEWVEKGGEKDRKHQWNLRLEAMRND